MSEEAKTPEATPIQEETYSASEYNKLLERSRTFEGRLKDYEEMDSTVKRLGGLDNIRGKLSDYDNLRKQNASSPEDIDALVSEGISELKNRYEEELEKKETALAEADTRYHNEVVRLGVGAEWHEELTPDGRRIAQELLIDKFCRKDEDGYYIVDEKGKPRYDGTRRLTPQDLLEESRETIPSIFANKGEVGTAKRGTASASKNNSTKLPPKGATKDELVEFFTDNPDYNVW